MKRLELKQIIRESLRNVITELGHSYDDIADDIYKKFKRDHNWEKKAKAELKKWGIKKNEEAEIMRMLAGEDYFDSGEYELEELADDLDISNIINEVSPIYKDYTVYTSPDQIVVKFKDGRKMQIKPGRAGARGKAFQVMLYAFDEEKVDFLNKILGKMAKNLDSGLDLKVTEGIDSLKEEKSKIFFNFDAEDESKHNLVLNLKKLRSEEIKKIIDILKSHQYPFLIYPNLNLLVSDNNHNSKLIDSIRKEIKNWDKARIRSFNEGDGIAYGKHIGAHNNGRPMKEMTHALLSRRNLSESSSDVTLRKHHKGPLKGRYTLIFHSDKAKKIAPSDAQVHAPTGDPMYIQKLSTIKKAEEFLTRNRLSYQTVELNESKLDLREFTDLEIEKKSKWDNIIKKTLYKIFVNNISWKAGADVMAKAAAKKYPNLLIGTGGHHVWIKDKNDLDNRLAIIRINDLNEGIDPWKWVEKNKGKTVSYIEPGTKNIKKGRLTGTVSSNTEDFAVIDGKNIQFNHLTFNENVTEGAMSHLDIIAQESKTFETFEKEALKAFPKLKKDAKTTKWLKDIYKQR